MKIIITLIFLAVGFSAYAQSSSSDGAVTTLPLQSSVYTLPQQKEKVTVKLTDLQKDKIKAIETAKQNLDAQLNEIIVFILDSKGIKASDVESIEPKEDEIIVTKKSKVK